MRRQAHEGITAVGRPVPRAERCHGIRWWSPWAINAPAGTQLLLAIYVWTKRCIYMDVRLDLALHWSLVRHRELSAFDSKAQNSNGVLSDDIRCTLGHDIGMGRMIFPLHYTHHIHHFLFLLHLCSKLFRTDDNRIPQTAVRVGRPEPPRPPIPQFLTPCAS
jgi:hypothetical protein